MPSDFDLAGFGSHASWRCLAYLMAVPRIPHADAYYVLRRCLALYGADACSDSCRCLACRSLTCPTSIHMRVWWCLHLNAIATLPLCHFATLSILRMCKLPSYKLLYIIIYNNSYYNIILLPSTLTLYYATTLKMKWQQVQISLMWQSGKVAKWQCQ